MLYSANNTPWEPHRPDEWVDPSKYIQTVTKNGIVNAITIDTDINLSELQADIRREMLQLRNQIKEDFVWHKVIQVFQNEILPLLKLFEEVSIEQGQESKSEILFLEVISEISDMLWIPREFSDEERINKLVDLLDRYKDMEERAWII